MYSIKAIVKSVVSIFLFFVCWAITSAQANTPLQWPGVTSWPLYSGTELCGDGADNNSDGISANCYVDKDLDGFLLDDCDDSNFQIYPGVMQTTGTDTYRVCQSDGTWSADISTPPAEGIRNFYVDSAVGNNANPGTPSAPWKDLSNIRYTNGGDPNPPSHIGAPQCGDVYYVAGVHNTTYEYGSGQKHLALRGDICANNEVVKVRDWPGRTPPVFVGTSSTSQEGGFRLTQGSYQLDGVNITGKMTNGVYGAENKTFIVSRSNIWSVNGTDNNNPAGVHINACGALSAGGGHCSVTHSRLINNIDTDHSDTAATTENSRNIVDFCLVDGSKVVISHNLIYNTINNSTLRGSGVVRKHGQNNCRLEVIKNRLAGHAFQSIGTAGPNTLIEGNLVLDAEVAFEVKDFGGWRDFRNVILHANTVIGGRAFNFVPDRDYGAILNLKVHNNVVIDDRTSYNGDTAFGRLCTYCLGDAQKAEIGTPQALQIDDNCYFNNNISLKFSYFLWNGGGLLSFADWIQSSSLDANSVVTDPLLDATGHPTASACIDKGYTAIIPSSTSTPLPPELTATYNAGTGKIHITAKYPPSTNLNQIRVWPNGSNSSLFWEGNDQNTSGVYMPASNLNSVLVTARYWSLSGVVSRKATREILIHPPYCNGKIVTVNLNFNESTTPNADVVIGTNSADSIKAKAGNDTVCGMGGNDFIHGNSGDDWIDGGIGIDDLRGGQGDDIVYTGIGSTVNTTSRAFGGKGDDEIYGGLQNDDIRGGRGADVLEGGSGNDLMFGNDGADEMYGGYGIDTLNGGQGNDQLYGEGSDDFLNGGNGDDVLDGGGGTGPFDVCDGGQGLGDSAVDCESEINIP